MRASTVQPMRLTYLLFRSSLSTNTTTIRALDSLEKRLEEAHGNWKKSNSSGVALGGAAASCASTHILAGPGHG